jgi:hypothetical protein
MIVLAEEWWHFEYGTRLWSTITGRHGCITEMPETVRKRADAEQ